MVLKDPNLNRVNCQLLNGKHSSHIQTTVNIANSYGINLNDYEIPIKNIDLHPAERILVNTIDLNQKEDCPLYTQQITIYFTQMVQKVNLEQAVHLFTLLPIPAMSKFSNLNYVKRIPFIKQKHLEF